MTNSAQAGTIDVNIKMEDILFQRIQKKMNADSFWDDNPELIPDMARFQVRRLRAIFKEMIGESYSTTITLDDVQTAKRKYLQELDIIRTVYAMRRQNRTEVQIMDYLTALE